MKLFIILLFFIFILCSGCLSSEDTCIDTTLRITDSNSLDINNAVVKATDGNSYVINLYLLSSSHLKPEHRYEVNVCKDHGYAEIKKVYTEV